MNITDVRVKILRRTDSKMKAVASVIIDNDFVVHDVKVIEADDGLFIVMPSRKMPDGDFRDIAHPLRTEVREYMRDLVLNAYQKAKAEAANNPPPHYE